MGIAVAAYRKYDMSSLCGCGTCDTSDILDLQDGKLCHVIKFDIDSLRTLQAVADAGTLQAAADQLCLSRSAVSWKLKRLQERTGCNLLRKEGRRLRLTDDGRELLAYGRQILDAHDAAVRRFLPIDTTGTVRVGATEGACTTPLLDTVAPWFRRHGPDVDLRISIDQPVTIDEWLTDGRIDLAVTLALEHDIAADDVVLSIDNLVWAHSAGIDVRELESIPLITWGPRCLFAPLATRSLSEAGIDHRVCFELPTSAAVLTALTSGAGVALINEGLLAGSNIATTNAPQLPALPRVAYLLRQNPATVDEPLQRAVADHIRASFRPQQLAGVIAS